jgi:hypothetical protein
MTSPPGWSRGRHSLSCLPALLLLAAGTARAEEPGPGTFRLNEIGATTDGGTRYLGTAGEPVKRCAFEIIVAKPQGAGAFAMAPATLVRHAHADCTAFLEALAPALGWKGKLPRAKPAPRLPASLAILGTEQTRSPDGSFASEPKGPWTAAKLFLADGEGEVFLNLNAHDGLGAFSAKDEDYAKLVITELGKVLLPDGPPIAKGKPWDKLSSAEKKQVMKTVVVPQLSAAWKELDPAHKDLDCSHCHGKAAKEGKFTMPNPDLPTLDFANRLRKERAEKTAITKFMFKRVVPEMVLALGATPFDMKTRQGFGCQTCHPVKN